MPGQSIFSILCFRFWKQLCSYFSEFEFCAIHDLPKSTYWYMIVLNISRLHVFRSSWPHCCLCLEVLFDQKSFWVLTKVSLQTYVLCSDHVFHHQKSKSFFPLPTVFRRVKLNSIFMGTVQIKPQVFPHTEINGKWPKICWIISLLAAYHVYI